MSGRRAAARAAAMFSAAPSGRAQGAMGGQAAVLVGAGATSSSITSRAPIR